MPWKPTDVLNSETLATIYKNNLVSPNIEIFPEFTGGTKSMSGRCGLPGNGSVSRLSRWEMFECRSLTADCRWPGVRGRDLPLDGRPLRGRQIFLWGNSHLRGVGRHCGPLSRRQRSPGEGHAGGAQHQGGGGGGQAQHQHYDVLHPPGVQPEPAAERYRSDPPGPVSPVDQQDPTCLPARPGGQGEAL